MAKGKLILICQAGGEFVTNDDGTMTYNGGEANAANVTSETPFNDLKLNLAETCDVNQETVSVKYFLPGNKRNLITVKNDKDVKRMVDFHGDALTAEVFVMGTPGFIRKPPDIETNGQTDTKNEEAVNNDDESMKKEEKVKQAKVGAKKDKKVKNEDEAAAKSPIASPARRTRRAVAAAKADAASHEKKKRKSNNANKLVGSTSDTSSSAASDQVDENVGSDNVPSRYPKRKKDSDQNDETGPADSVKKRKRTPSWKLGANGRPTIVDDSVGSKSSGSGSKSSQRKSGRLAAKREGPPETKSGKKRGRPRNITADQELVESVGPSAVATCNDDMSPETLVAVWKSAITGVGQEFINVHEFQEALQKYAMANDFEFKLKKNDTNRVSGQCAFEGCSWKFNAVWVPSTQSFKIKTMNNVHTCDNESKNWLANTITDRLRESPHLKPNDIANGLLKGFGIASNPAQGLQDVKTDVFQKQVYESDKADYNKLPWFCDKIMETNPGSISKLVVGENKRFKALFVSFYASLCGFQSACRPLLFLEATSLRSRYGEYLLTANAIDGNDGFFLVAFAIVDVENNDNWHWFLEQLKSAILNSPPITFVFDKEKNLKTSILEIFQDSYVGYSIYHLLESFKRNVKGPFHGDGKSFLPVHFLAAAHAVRLGGFRKSTEQIKQISSQAYDWVMQIEPQHYTTSSFKGERYNHVIDDVGGPLSKLMDDYKELLILHKIDAIIRTMIDAISDANLDGSMWSTHLTPSKEKDLQQENLRSCGLKVLISSDTLFEVREDSTHVVNTSSWSCTCLGWKETGLPCRHALAVCALTGRNPYEFCSNYFTVDAYRLTYIECVNPVPIEKEEGEKMEVDIWGEIDEASKLEVGNEESLEKIVVHEENGESLLLEEENGENIIIEEENVENIIIEEENVENIIIEEENDVRTEVAEENGERIIEVVEEHVENIEVQEENSEMNAGNEKEIEESEKVEIVNEDEKGEMIEIEKLGGEETDEVLKEVGGEKEEGTKVEDEKVEVEKIEGEENGDNEKIISEEDDPDVLVLPPIPPKPVDIIKEKMEWDEAEVETKRTVTCTNCKQPGHNKKSCNLYQAAQQSLLTSVN